MILYRQRRQSPMHNKMVNFSRKQFSFWRHRNKIHKAENWFLDVFSFVAYIQTIRVAFFSRENYFFQNDSSGFFSLFENVKHSFKFSDNWFWWPFLHVFFYFLFFLFRRNPRFSFTWTSCSKFDCSQKNLLSSKCWEFIYRLIEMKTTDNETSCAQVTKFSLLFFWVLEFNCFVQRINVNDQVEKRHVQFVGQVKIAFHSFS